MKTIKLDFPMWQIFLAKFNSGDYISKISRDLDITYAHCRTIIVSLKRVKLVYSEPRGRLNIIYRTKLGQEIKEYLLICMVKIRELQK